MGNDVPHLCSMASALQNLCREITAHSVTVAADEPKIYDHHYTKIVIHPKKTLRIHYAQNEL